MWYSRVLPKGFCWLERHFSKLDWALLNHPHFSLFSSCKIAQIKYIPIFKLPHPLLPEWPLASLVFLAPPAATPEHWPSQNSSAFFPSSSSHQLLRCHGNRECYLSAQHFSLELSPLQRSSSSAS